MKKFILGIIALAITLNTFSQSYTPPAYADIDNNYRNYVNNLFGSLEPNHVATGLLIDYAFDFLSFPSVLIIKVSQAMCQMAL